MSKKPRVISPCVAERYNRRSGDSRIVEFMDTELQAGGLIEFRRRNGELLVIPYQLDGAVRVVAPDAKRDDVDDPRYQRHEESK